ncbi:MAG: hypothetical protein HOL08_17740 [Opitutae bacterium]|nr:hypothetical protein [Opitutae bacterium]
MKGTTQIIILWGLSLSLAFFLGLQKGKERDPSLSLDVHHEVNGGQSVLPVRGASDIGITGKDFGQRKFIHSFPQNNGS